jgi:cobalt-precorrin 5A hydrolase/precorrin-3B C17-methyltransferase
VKRVVCCSVTAAGAQLGRRLPFEHRAGQLVENVRDLWSSVDALVLVGAVGIAVRAVAPLLGDKRHDPGVVCVDDAGRFVVALCGGHIGGANALAREVAALLGAEPVISTASDAAGLPPLDDLPGLRAAGDVAGVTRRWLEGAPPAVRSDPALAAWPRPADLPVGQWRGGGDGGVVTVTDAGRPAAPLEVLLRPPSLVVGVGSSTGADADALADLVVAALAQAGLAAEAVGAVATLDRKAGEPAIVALGQRLEVPVRTFDAATLAGVPVPNPSEAVAGAVGTASVAEAAALIAGGPGATLVATKQVSATGDSTVAVARRAAPAGSLSVVGLGPGEAALRTAAAVAAVRHADAVIGYEGYVGLASDLLRPGQQVVGSPIGAEIERCREALARAAGGQHVALVCSGDPGVYALASLVMELAPAAGDPPVTVVPGVTAALSAAAVLGAPLGHDHAAVSLSDLLTPWDVIARRLRAAAEGDFVVTLYNPRSSRRTTQLTEALAILARHRGASTPAAVLTDVGRPNRRVVRTHLARLDPEGVSMRSLVVVGSSTTRWIGGRMVTPRGYTTHRGHEGYEEHEGHEGRKAGESS